MCKDAFILVLGLVIGLCTAQIIEIMRCSDQSFRQSRGGLGTINSFNRSSRYRSNPHHIVGDQQRPKYAKDELIAREPLYAGVVTTIKFLNTRAMDINGTWGHKLPKVDYFVAEGQGLHPLSVVSLKGIDDTYPPQKKVYRMLRYMHDKYIDKYNWFLRADDDVYIRVPQLLEFLSTLDPTLPWYIGSPGLGRPEDLERIKLFPNERYCMGGPGVIFSRALLIQLVPHLDDCLENVVVSYNEDLEVGRCISRRLGIQCTWAYEVGPHALGALTGLLLEVTIASLKWNRICFLQCFHVYSLIESVCVVW